MEWYGGTTKGIEAYIDRYRGSRCMKNIIRDPISYGEIYVIQRCMERYRDTIRVMGDPNVYSEVLMFKMCTVMYMTFKHA